MVLVSVLCRLVVVSIIGLCCCVKVGVVVNRRVKVRNKCFMVEVF